MKILYKILLTVFAMCLGNGSIYGQMSITKFEKLPNDLDAKVNYKKINPNDGQPYALIKITTDLSCDGFTSFDFGQVGFGVMADCSLGTWVYAPASATRVSITHKMGGSLAPTMINEGKPLEAGTVYVMTLSSNRVVVTYEEETLNIGYFVVQCNVVGARIRIDDGEAEIIGQRYSKALSRGEHTYQAYADGYETKSGRISIGKESITTLNVDLKRKSAGPAVCQLLVRCNVDGAQIRIDGGTPEFMPDAQWSKYLSPGRHSYEVFATGSGYEPESGTIYITNEETTMLNVNLKYKQ